MNARAVRASLLVMAAGGCRLGDLVSTPHSPPTAPTGLAQSAPDLAQAIPTGQFTTLAAVLLSARVSDPDAGDQIVLQVEVRPVGMEFLDSATAVSAPTHTDTTASVIVSGLADNLAYHWQARVVDQTGRASAWASYGDNAESETDFGMDALVEPPAQPASLVQLESDGTTAIAVGGTTGETTVIFQAALSDPDPGDSIRLELQRLPVDSAFSDTTGTAVSGPVASGQTARVTVSGQREETSYHWRVRGVDRGGLYGGWISFGGNPETDPDYRISIPATPYQPDSLGQFRAPSGQQAIAVGDTTYNQSSIVLKARLTDPNVSDSLRLEVEVRETVVGFSDTATAAASIPVANGTIASLTVTGLVAGKNYHWQARTVDQTGKASPWVPFGGNAESAPDFGIR